MVWHCPVGDCGVTQEHNPDKLSAFGVPSNNERKEAWRRILNCNFQGSVRVCEKHFSPDDIQRDYHHEYNGKVILQGKYQRVHLKRGALPRSRDERDEIPAKILKIEETPVAVKNPENGNVANVTNVLENEEPSEDSNCLILNTPRKHASSIPRKSIFDTCSRTQEIQVLDNLNQNENARESLLENVDQSRLRDAYCNDIIQPNENEQGELYLQLRKNIMQDTVSVELPDSQAWAIIRNNKSDSLLFVYGEEQENPRTENVPMPISTKIVSLTKSKLVTWFRDKNIKLDCDEKPGNLKELKNILELVHSYNICTGGPPTTFCPNAVLQAAYKDKFVWRHIKCDLVLQSGNMCINCTRVHRLLSDYTKRTVKKRRRDKFGLLTPRTRGSVKKLQQKVHTRTKIIRKKGNKIMSLCEELDDSLDKLKQIENHKVDVLLDMMKGEKISENQRVVIQEIVSLSKAKKPFGPRYSPEWLLNCLLLHIKSPTAYNLLRNQKILPLPCKSTINRYLKNSNVGVGFDDSFFSLFAKKLDVVCHENPAARYGILAFDEIQVKKALNVNVESMTFSGLMNFGSKITSEGSIESNKKNTFASNIVKDTEAVPEDSNEKNNSILERSEDNNNIVKETVQNLQDKQADHALVFMFSSLGSSFHQPVGMFASKHATKSHQLAQLIISAIIAIEKSRGFVVGFVCDGAATNRAIWTDLGISGKVGEVTSSFNNPFEGTKHMFGKREENRKIYVFSDAPHLIKCIRNNLFSRKMFKINGQFVKWEYYEQLYKIDEQSLLLRLCPKLTVHHIKPVNMLKMRVFLATQIFSNAVADALRDLLGDPNYSTKFTGCEETIQFTKLVNDMFDLLNISNPITLSADPRSRHRREKFIEDMNKCIEWLDSWEREIDRELKNIKEHYQHDIATETEPEKKKIIDKKYKEMKKIINDQFLTRSTAQGLRITLKSTLGLSGYLLETHDFKFVLTRKFNQDCLEKFFETVRLAGRQNDHPTLPNFMQIYHLLSIYQILKPPKFGNCENTEADEQRPKLALDDFKKAFDGSKSKNFRQTQLRILEKKLEDFVEDGDWDVGDIELDDTLMSSDLKNKVMYYVVGFICKKMLKTSERCPECCKAFESQNTVSIFPVAELTNTKNRGKLIYPGKYIFETLLEIENIFAENLTAENILDAVMEEILKRKIHFKFPCRKHKASRLAECIHFYITARLKQTARLLNRQDKNTNVMRKQAKVIVV